jgi:hypothetical protein
MLFHLGPVFRDIEEVLGIEVDLFEEAPLCFDLSEVVFGLGFAAFFLEQVFLAPDFTNGFSRERQVKIAADSFGAPGLQLSFEFDGSGSLPRIDFGLSLVRVLAAILQAVQGARLPAAQPFADGFRSGAEAAGRWFDTMAPGIIDQLET